MADSIDCFLHEIERKGDRKVMNEGQEIFTILFGLYSAIILSLTGPLQPFDTPSMYGHNLRKEAWLRFCVSFFILNVIPFGFFYYVYRFLGNYCKLTLNCGAAFGIFFLSLVIFGFYRIYWGVMLYRPNNRGRYFFYGWALPKSLEDELKKRGDAQRDYEPHLRPGIIWVVISGAVGYLMVFYSQLLITAYR